MTDQTDDATQTGMNPVPDNKEDLLDRTTGAVKPESWNPDAKGESLVGTVDQFDTVVFDEEYGETEVVMLRDAVAVHEMDGEQVKTPMELVRVPLFHKRLEDEFQEKEVAVDDDIGIKYYGEKNVNGESRTYHDYEVIT